MSKLQKRELGLATMLLFVVSVFFICNLLPLVNNILESFYDYSIDQLVHISNFLVILNSSVNFVIYCSCGERFRKMLLRMCADALPACCCSGSVADCGRMGRKGNLHRPRHGKSRVSSRLASVRSHICEFFKVFTSHTSFCIFLLQVVVHLKK